MRAATTDASAASPIGAGREVVRATAAVLAGAALYGLAFPPLELAPLAALAHVPMFALAVAAREARTVRIAGIVFGTLAYAIPLRWLFDVLGEVALGLYAIFGILSAVGLTLVWWLRQRWGVGWALVIAPVVLVGLENFRSEHWALRFGWASPGYAQVADPRIAQLAELAGVYGLSLLAYGAAAAWAWALVAEDAARGRRAAVALAPIVLWLAGATYGSVRREVDFGGEPLRVAAVQYETNRVEDAERLARSLSGEARLVVFPEVGAVLLGERSTRLDDAAMVERLGAIARAANAAIVIGGARDAAEPREWRNSLIWIGADGVPLHTYAKAEPVPLFADGVRSGPSGPRETPLGRLGLAICYDFTHPHVALSALSTASLAVVASGDLRSWGALQHLEHARIAQLRAIEHRTWVVRATSSGDSQLIAPSGEPIATLGFGEEGVLEGEVRRTTVTTPYEHIGLMLPYACLATTVVLLGYAVVTVVRARRSTQGSR